MEREERRIITTLVKFAWCLGVCRYCRKVWVFYFVWWLFAVLEGSGLSAVRRKGGVFMDCESLCGCRRLRLKIWSGFSFKWLFAATSVRILNLSSAFRRDHFL